nr:glycosyl hydrolase 5 family protein-like [Ipomoea batatas]
MAKSYSFLLCVIILCSTVVAQPLSTNSRWIVNESGRRVKLACVNWVTHLEVAVAEGLSKQPVDVISKKIVDMGFNCVRLTWPLFLFTNDSLASLTVRQSFKNLGLLESIAGLQANNPSIVDLPLITAYQVVVGSLAKYKVMIILDNHISKPGWCCSSYDGNGFFGDIYFDPKLWVIGLTKVATMFNGTSNVVGISLRNELRGPKQNVNDWYRYMQQGAEAVHAANPDLLVILSGLSFDKDLSFLQKTPVNLTFSGKLVFEVHRYGFTDGEDWASGNPNKVCGRITNDIMSRGGFVLDKGYPLFVSEFGIDLRGTNVNDNRYFNCFLGLAAELDFDWALWTLAGSYYLREGSVGLEEFYGVLTWNWCEPRNLSFLQRISIMQSPFRGPGYTESRPHKLIFHPMTGLCVRRVSLFQPLELGPCSESDPWGYTASKTLTVEGTYFCLQAEKLGKPAKLGLFCTDDSSKWEIISDSRMHLSSKLKDGSNVCLDVDSNNVIITNTCKCLNNDSSCDPASQWFKITDSTRGTATKSDFQSTSFLYFLAKKLFASYI